MKCNWLLRAIVYRAYLERVRVHRALRWKVKGRYVYLTFPKKERAAFIALIRGDWDGDEKTLPHRPGCEVLFMDDDHPGPCTCGITQLARSQVLRASLSLLRWQAERASICFRQFRHSRKDRASGAQGRCNCANPTLGQLCQDLIETFLQPIRHPYLTIRELSGEVQIRGARGQVSDPGEAPLKQKAGRCLSRP